MTLRRTLLTGLAASILLGGAAGAAPSSSPQSRAPEADRWAALVQMPVAVARLELAGVPRSDLERMIPPLNSPAVPPEDFLEAVRGIPLLWGADYDPADDYDPPADRAAGVDPVGGSGTSDQEAVPGAYVQSLLGSGLRGPELAREVRDEMGRRGIPSAPAGPGVLAPTLHRDFIPDDLVDGRFRDDPFFRPGPGTSDASGADPPAADGAIRLFRKRGADARGASPGEPDAPPAVRTDTSGESGPSTTPGRAGEEPR